MNAPNILIIAGTANSGSPCAKLAGVMTKVLAERGALTTRISLEDYDLPIFDGEIVRIPVVQSMSKLFAAHHGVVVVNPQHAGTISPMLANALIWASALDDKWFPRLAFGLIACEQGPSGGSESLSHLRDMLVSVGGHVVSPQLGVCTDGKMFDLKDELANTQNQAVLEDLSSHLIAQASTFLRG